MCIKRLSSTIFCFRIRVAMRARRRSRPHKSIRECAAKLVETLETSQLPAGIKTEEDLERRIVVPLAMRIASADRGLKVYTHPWNNRNRCAWHWRRRHARNQPVKTGCPVCWRESKKWASVHVLGTQHTFNVVVRDLRSGATLVIEVKLISVKRGRRPNGEIQRFFGQCVLAATRHQVVIGICGYRGTLNPELDRDKPGVLKWCKGSRILILFRKVP